MLKGLLLFAAGDERWQKGLSEESLPWILINGIEEQAVFEALEEIAAEKEEVLCMVETDEQERFAKTQGLLCVGYLNPAFPGERLSGCEMLLEGLEEVDRTLLEEIHARALCLPVQIAETQRLILREFSAEDWDELYELYEEAERKEFLPEWCGHREEEKSRFEAYIRQMYGLYHFGSWGVFEKERGKLIGRAGLGIAGYMENSEIDLGYFISRPYRRRGYAREACDAVLRYAKERLELAEVSAYVHAENKESIHLLEKLGFRIEREQLVQTRTIYRCILKFN